MKFEIFHDGECTVGSIHKAKQIVGDFFGELRAHDDEVSAEAERGAYAVLNKLDVGQSATFDPINCSPKAALLMQFRILVRRLN